VALVIVSDGKDMGAGVLAAADALRTQFKDRLCIYTVLVGDDAAGRALFTKISALTGCGAEVNADELATGPGMAAFVRKVLLTKLADSDGDGVPNVDDRCPGTARGVAVDIRGCPKDSDKDGVIDSLDRCPGTPAGVRVDKTGCPLPQTAPKAVVTKSGTWIYRDVQFENNRSDLKPSSYPVLDDLVGYLKANPGVRVEIQGHTDSRGSRAYNMKLSQRRAESVMAYLASKGIAADRMTARGYGPDQPIASNDTARGRAENRRVEFKPIRQ